MTKHMLTQVIHTNTQRIYSLPSNCKICGRSLHVDELENVFGQLKNNRGFRKLLLRGMEKVTLGRVVFTDPQSTETNRD